MGMAKILFVGSNDVRYRIPLLLELRRRGFDVAAAGSEDGAPFAAPEIPYQRFDLNREVNPWDDLRSLAELRRLFVRMRPDVVHAFTTKPAILGPLAARRAGVPGIVRTVTGMGHLFSSRSPQAMILRPVYRLLQRRASTASDLTVFQNDDDRDYFVRHRLVDRDRCSVIRSSGIDIGRLEAGRPDAPGLARLRRQLKLNDHLVVTMVARLLKEKGVREYLEAARLVRGAMSNVVFLLVGSASTEGRRAVPLDLVRRAEDVRYLGPRTDIPALLSLSHLFVLPTWYREGVPRVLLEAGAIGLPLITTDMPGCRDVVRDGWNGHLVPPRDSRSLAAAILRLLRSPARRAAMGERSQALVRESYSLDRVAAAHADLYPRVLSARRAARRDGRVAMEASWPT